MNTKKPNKIELSVLTKAEIIHLINERVRIEVNHAFRIKIKEVADSRVMSRDEIASDSDSISTLSISESQKWRVMEQMGIKTIGGLCSLQHDNDLLKYRNFGRTSLNRLKNALAVVGRKLGDRPPVDEHADEQNTTP
jgi:DNA-directed RNA polymerase alpha subunit